ncbi:hypothetical protein H310_13628 [Aphanomyces invadans]|uniref:Uncharacterized protein n=1 Tax=Aphanomyces invadans TaxID=157072 RepID=A0A024TEH7_9STRA|nr:hypothetical protein H310_13628 [Aphanomyces invadans]ETV91991.1 hypothetical protein H310_13628 [Aphanomyces invadans]|eukprot:XP_008879415.1 hypothetical protein H310_13628 [Aphanomyces invadans]
MGEEEMMSRAEFVKALALALAANDEQDAVAPEAVARAAYESLQFDFPQISPSQLKALATHMRDDTATFPLTYMLLRNALELAQSSDGGSSAAAALLVQCFFLPFHASMDYLTHFHLQDDSSIYDKLLFISYHTTYAPLSSLSLDDWNHFQCTDLCCSIASTLLHYPTVGGPSAVLLQMEWLRYMYLLRDRILQYPVTCASILHKMLHFFHSPANLEAIEASRASAAPLRLLLDIASSKELKQASMAKSSILSLLRTMMPMMAKQLMLLVESPAKASDDARHDDVLIHAQLLEWAVLEDPPGIAALLEDSGVLRSMLRFITMTSRPTKATTTELLSIAPVKHSLRIVVLCMLFRPTFAEFIERVPSMNQWTATDTLATKYAAEHTLWLLSKSLGQSTPSPHSLWKALASLFPVQCDHVLAATTRVSLPMRLNAR